MDTSVESKESTKSEPADVVLKRLEQNYNNEQAKLNDLTNDLMLLKDRVIVQQQLASRAYIQFNNMQNQYLMSIIQEQNKQLQNKTTTMSNKPE